MSPSGAGGRVRARAGSPLAGDRLFHWEYQAPPVAPQAFRVTGGRPLRGRLRVSGSKNAALKMLAAATLTGERCRFTNVPEIEDVRVMAGVLQDLGVTVDHPAEGTYEVAAGDVEWLFVPLEAAAKMRASFILLGPLLGRFGRVIISNPGGDRIGRRPVNLHVDAMRALGAEIDYRNGYYFARAPGRLRGAELTFPQVTVMGTENAILAAVLADGTTTIRPAAREPEVDDLIAFLQKMGAEVSRTAPDTIVVSGRRRLRGADHQIISDRIEAGTFVVAAAVTGGEVTLESAPCEHLGAFLEVMAQTGVAVACGRDTIEVRGARVELVDDHNALIHGPSPLHGAEVEMGDLRAGASLIVAALAAQGESLIHGGHHVRRGYENIERKFLDLGAQVELVSDSQAGISA